LNAKLDAYDVILGKQKYLAGDVRYGYLIGLVVINIDQSLRDT